MQPLNHLLSVVQGILVSRIHSDIPLVWLLRRHSLIASRCDSCSGVLRSPCHQGSTEAWVSPRSLAYWARCTHWSDWLVPLAHLIPIWTRHTVPSPHRQKRRTTINGICSSLAHWVIVPTPPNRSCHSSMRLLLATITMPPRKVLARIT